VSILGLGEFESRWEKLTANRIGEDGLNKAACLLWRQAFA
jgi:hypothetical protein